MRCPKCGHLDDKVLDSRAAREGASIRRRRQCLACEYRFTTYEEIVKDELRVIKRDNRREEFSRLKLERGLMRACEKRPVSADQIHDLVDQVIESFEGGSEVTSEQIGQAGEVARVPEYRVEMICADEAVAAAEAALRAAHPYEEPAFDFVRVVASAAP